MLNNVLIKNAQIVNEGVIFNSDVLVKNGRIEKIAPNIQVDYQINEIDASGLYLLPGIIDDQVHFREPGLTHKANIATESAAAIAGGVTSFMEMPNTNPATLTQELLEQKYQIAKENAMTNYSFFMGAGNDNFEEVMKTNHENVCGLKIFMGSSTGNMLVDNEAILDKLFSNVSTIIATHCEDENTVRNNLAIYKEKFGDSPSAKIHPLIRNHEACLMSSQKAINLAKKYNTRLHILHISTGIETNLFSNDIPLIDKRITSEACVHHLFFNDSFYETLGNNIKCNPAIKSEKDQNEIWNALLDNRIDIIATDHAPHTIEEKSKPYFDAPAGLPLVQHALSIMLDFYFKGKISLQKIVEKMSHAPAQCFRMKERGFIREGYFADLFLLDLNKEMTIAKDNILYKCGWSPLEGMTFKGEVTHTFINGVLQFSNGKLMQQNAAQRLTFEKDR